MRKKITTSNKVPADIEFLVSNEGAYIEVESFINFLRDQTNIPDAYKEEAPHLLKMADYLEDQFGEVLAQKVLMDEIFNKDRPN
jgi:hypothetical protein